MFNSKDGCFSTKIDGEELGSIKSKTLVRAFMRMYLGPNPVSPDARDSFGKGLAGLL